MGLTAIIFMGLVPHQKVYKVCLEELTEKAKPTARSNTEFSGFNGFNLSGEVFGRKEKEKRKTRHQKVLYLINFIFSLYINI